MADAKNTDQELSAAAPAGAVDDVVGSIGYYAASSGGDPLGGDDISNTVEALVLGEKFEHAANSLVIRQPVAVDAEITQINNSGGYNAAATQLTVDSNTAIENNQYVAIDHGTTNGYRAYKVTAHTDTSITIDPGLEWSVDDNASVKVALETEAAARKKLEGLITSSGIYIEYFTGTWADTHFGTVNRIDLGSRTHVDNWTYDP